MYSTFTLLPKVHFGCTLVPGFPHGCQSPRCHRAAQHNIAVAAGRHREQATGAGDAGVCRSLGGPQMLSANAAVDTHTCLVEF